MLARSPLIDQIASDLNLLRNDLKLKSSLNLNNSAVLSEDLFGRILNLTYGYQLSNANERVQNAPVVDLEDIDGRIAVQITVQDTAKKIRDTYEKALHHGLSAIYDKIIILFVAKKAPTRPLSLENCLSSEKPEIELLDISRLLSRIKGLDLPKIQQIYELLKIELTHHAGQSNGDVRALNNLPRASLGSIFKGRSAFIDELRSCLAGEVSEARPVVICALGGVGKTRTAIEYAWRHQGEYQSLLFVSAATPQILKDDILALSELLGASVSPENGGGAETSFASVLDWLQSQKNWLLIIDNADSNLSLEAVLDLLPKLSRGHVCITSRLSNWPASVHCLDLDVLTDGEGAEYLLEVTARRRSEEADDDTRASALSSRLGGLVLALEHAAAYIKKMRCSIRSYHETLDAQSAEILDWHGGNLVEYPKSVSQTWHITFAELTPDEREILRILSWFDHAPVPRWLVGPIRPNGSALDSHPLLAGLAGWNFVDFDKGVKSLSIHRLVQEVTRNNLPNVGSKNSTIAAAFAWVSEANLGNAQDFRNWSRWVPMLPHILALATKQEGIHLFSKSCVAWLRQAASLLLLRGQFETARDILEKALEIAEIHIEPGHELRRSLVMDFANFLGLNDNPQEAEKIYRKALASEEAENGADCPEIAVILNNYGSLLGNLGRLDEAASMLNRALEIDAMHFNENDPKFAYRWGNLGELETRRGNFESAHSLNLKVLSVFESNFGPTDPNVAKILRSIARNLRQQGKLHEALPYLKRAMGIYFVHQVKYDYENPEFVGTWTMFRDISDELGLPSSDSLEIEFDSEFIEKWKENPNRLPDKD